MAKRRPLLPADDDPTAGILPGCEFLPRWYEPDLDVQYGPSLSKYQELCREWRQSRAGGGLWDDEEAERCNGGRLVVDRANQPRKDIDLVSEFMAKKSGRLSLQYLRVFQLFWVGRQSYLSVAKEMNTTTDHVKKIVQRIRRKVRDV